MYHLSLSTTEEGFKIGNFPVKKIVLRFKKQDYPLAPTKSGDFLIPKDLLAEIKEPGESIISILAPTSEGTLENVSFDSMELTATSELYFDYEGSRYFLYVSQQNTLRVITDQNPSVSSYYDSHITEKKEAEPGVYTLTIESRHFKITELRIILRERTSKRNEVLIAKLQQQEDIGKGLFRNTFDFTISSNNLWELTDPTTTLADYNLAIYDLFFNFSIAEQPLTAYEIRMSYMSDRQRIEEVIDFNTDYKTLIQLYPTNKYNNLSLKASFVPTETLEYYEQIKLGQNLPAKNTTKKTMIILEYPHKAQDNGLVFFKYMIDNHQSEFNIFYLITPDSKDLSNLAGYEDHLIFYKSKKHLEIFIQTDILVHTHTRAYALPFISDFFNSYLDDFFKILLRHGVLGVRDMSKLYGNRGEKDYTNLFLVSSEREKQLVINDFGYTEEQVEITGLARFDNLLDIKSKLSGIFAKKQLLIMPTWRAGLDHLADDEFKATDYYKQYTSLIQSSELKMYAERYKLRIVFYLHTNFQKYSHLFKSDFVEIIEEGSITVQELLKASNILITDYSSVGLDFAILKRPIIYFQFDDLPIHINTNNQDIKSFLPGNIAETELELMDQLLTIKPGDKMEDRFIRRLPNIYAFNDRKANERIYNTIKSRITK